MSSSNAKNLGERPLEYPQNLTSPVQIFALQSIPESHLGTMEPNGRVFQLDYNKTVVGWVDAQGNAFRNDYNRTKVGRVDLQTRVVSQADYNNTVVGFVHDNGQIFASANRVHTSLTDTPIGRVDGPPESYAVAAAAFFLLF